MAVYSRQGLAEPATYDYASHPVAVGGHVYTASSADEALYCFDAESGKRLWGFHAEGPVRFAPIIEGKKLYFCSDDGSVYCLDADSGQILWQRRISPKEGFAFNNTRLMSAWPVRGGLTLAGGKLYCAAGVFPEQGVYLAALDPATGAPVWTQTLQNAVNGPLLVDDETLWTPTHRTAPCAFDLKNGSPRMTKMLPLIGRGAAPMWSIDGHAAWGPDEAGIIYLHLSCDSNAPGAKMKRGGQSPIGTVSTVDGWCALAGSTHFAMVQDDRVAACRIEAFRNVVAERLAALQSGKEPPAEQAAYSKLGGSIARQDDALYNRIEKAFLWTARIPAGVYRTAIMTGDALILGGSNSVMALDLKSGAERWKAPVEGRIWGLAVANGTLYAAADSGALYCFRNGVGKSKEITPSRSTASDPAFVEAAKTALSQTGRSRGICVIAGGGEGMLAAEIARQSKFNVVILEPDPSRAAAQRKNLNATGIYGTRVVVRQESGAALSGYPFGMANLLLSEEALETGRYPYPPEKLLPLLQPYGGVVVVASRKGVPDLAGWPGSELSPWKAVPGAKVGDWRVAIRGALPGGGQWPTVTGTPGNSMNTGESRVPAAGADLALQWFGAPFASESIDRHAVPMPPLFMNGIAVILGREGKVIVLDAYNGTRLWDLVIPDTDRILASHNSSPLVFSADGRFLFAVAGEECWKFDAITGEKKAVFKGIIDGTRWGYIGSCGGVLIGTSQGGMDFSTTGGKQTEASVDWAFSAPAVSRDIFAMDPESGKKLWTFSDGLILNPSIAIGNGRIFLAQSRNSAASANKAGNMKMGDWIAKDQAGGAEIVALDVVTGKAAWRAPIERALDAESHWIMYLTVAGDSVLATRSLFKKEGNGSRRGYDFELLDAKTGASRWNRWFPSLDDGKHFGLSYGKNSLSARPIIVGDKFWLRTNFDARSILGMVFEFSLTTGEPVGKPIPTGSHDAGCSVAMGSENALYFRDYEHASLDLATGKEYRLTGSTRPSCWPSTLPAGGILFAPEGGAGCSCGLSYQLSFALAPQRKVVP